MPTSIVADTVGDHKVRFQIQNSSFRGRIRDIFSDHHMLQEGGEGAT